MVWSGGITPVLVAQSVAMETAGRSAESAVITVDLESEDLEQVLRVIAHQAGLNLVVRGEEVPQKRHVALHARRMPVAEAFAMVLRGTGLQASIQAGTVVLSDVSAPAVSASGIITGTVLNATTHQPIRGAAVTIDDLSKGVISGENGMFRMSGVASGAHIVRVKMLGFVKAAQRVVVVDGEVVMANVSLSPSVNTLEQVVVTGTVVPTELKAVPNAITIITAKQIEERGITHIDQLFRGDVPGLFAQVTSTASPIDQVTMFSRGATALSNRSVGTQNNTNPIKTYLDGVELSDPAFLSQIDPKSIERIEIVTGPQASTIYGSNALNGVMQIFTKRGNSVRPQLTLNGLNGWTQNNFNSALATHSNYSTSVNGVEGRWSYNAGGSWDYSGPWAASRQTTVFGGFGGARLTLPTKLGLVTADLSLRTMSTRNRSGGDGGTLYASQFDEGSMFSTVHSGGGAPRVTTRRGRTAGLDVSHGPTTWWSYTVGLGQDEGKYGDFVTGRMYANPHDTTLSLNDGQEVRSSLHGTTTVRVPLTSLASATVTGGADSWESLTESFTVYPQALTGTFTQNVYATRRPSHNAGAFLQTQLGVQDRLFFTYGLRAEWNPGFGAAVNPNYTPRYGVAYTQTVGAVTAKLRGSYGRSTRPPNPSYKVGVSATDYGLGFFIPEFGNFEKIIANPELTPEIQKGGEGGLDLYLGNRGSITITRYNQTVDQLLDAAVVDSVRSLDPYYSWSQGTYVYDYVEQLQFRNLATIRNQGWELQGSVNLGPFTTTGTYSWTKSRTIGVNPKYRSQYTADRYPQYQKGATFAFLPEHTWAAGVTYTHARGSVALNLTGIGALTTRGNELFYRHLDSFIRLDGNRWRMNDDGSLVIPTFNRGYAMTDLNASQRLAGWAEMLLQVHNLTDYYPTDAGGQYATPGRQTQLGFRLRLQ